MNIQPIQHKIQHARLDLYLHACMYCKRNDHCSFKDYFFVNWFLLRTIIHYKITSMHNPLISDLMQPFTDPLHHCLHCDRTILSACLDQEAYCVCVITTQIKCNFLAISNKSH